MANTLLARKQKMAVRSSGKITVLFTTALLLYWLQAMSTTEAFFNILASSKQPPQQTKSSSSSPTVMPTMTTTPKTETKIASTNDKKIKENMNIITSPDILLRTSLTNLFKKSSSSTPSPGQVIEAAEYFMAHGGYFNPLDESILSEDFVFRGPVIGPLNKADYISVLEYFGIYKAFPDIDPNCFGYSVDPENPYRVWFFVRATGTYQAPLGAGAGADSGAASTVLKFLKQTLLPKPDGRIYRGSPEAWSVTFEKEEEETKKVEEEDDKQQSKMSMNRLKVKCVTAGYVSDRFDSQSTTNGKGLSFGILQTIGLDSPSGIGDARLKYVQNLSESLSKTGLLPVAVSDPEKVPKWWTSVKRGADN